MDEPRENGWYRDPRHPERHRYWDGSRWQSQSEHLARAEPPEAAAEDTPVPEPVADRP